MKKESQPKKPIEIVRKKSLKRLLQKKEYRATKKAKAELEYSIHTVTNFVIELARANAKKSGRKTITDKDIAEAKWAILKGEAMEK